MDIAEREAMARAIVDGNGYMTLGTADANGLPWASPVWYAPASYREFFWVSKPGARHSQNIAVRPEVGIVIFDSTVPMGTGRAVYLAARTEQVTPAGEIERGMTVFSRRSLERGGRGWTPDDVGLDARLRLYRATAPSSSSCRRRTSGCRSTSSSGGPRHPLGVAGRSFCGAGRESGGCRGRQRGCGNRPGTPRLDSEETTPKCRVT